MPIVEQLDCPYCMTKASGFQAVGAYGRYANTIRESRSGVVTYQHEDWFLLSCGKCKKCITATYQYRREHADRQLPAILASHGSLKDHNYSYQDHAPKHANVDEPEFVPPNVIVPFRQAIANIAASNWDAAGTMARKTLEVSTKDMVRRKFSKPDEQEKLIRKTWLKNRIDKLFEAGHLTKELAELAILIKDEGDEATHDETPYEENDARELLGFSQALLTYVYTIPGMVSDVKSRLQGDTTEPDA